MTSKRKPSVQVSALLVGALWMGSALSAEADVDLFVTKTGPGSVKLGEPIAYVIDVVNFGPDDAAEVVLADPTPAGLTFVANSGDCTTPFPCDLGTVPSGQTRTINATFLVPANYAGPDPIFNTATATTSTPEVLPLDNTSTSATALLRIAGFHTLPPCRIIDTRGSPGPLGGPALGAGLVRTFNVRETCGLPGNASAVSLNITVTGPTDGGNLRLFAGGSNPPLASAINYSEGQTRANNGIVPLSTTGTLSVKSDQVSGATHLILDVNGYFSVSDEVPTPAGNVVRIRPAPEVELTFDNVTGPGVTTATVIEFLDNRTQETTQDLRDFFPPGSPYRALLPSVEVPPYVKALGKGGPAGPPTFVLTIVDTTATFSRTAEFHGLEDFRLGWHPPCVVSADPTQEPRTFYAREPQKNEPSLVEESQVEGPIFVDISSGCGSNKASGWNFSLYLTGRDSRTPEQIAQFMLDNLQLAISSLGQFIDSGIAAQLQSQVSAAIETLNIAPASSLTSINNFLSIVDAPANVGLFDNSQRNVRGEMAGRAQSARYMIGKLLPTGTFTEFPVPAPAGKWPWGITAGPDGNLWFAETFGDRIGRITPAGVITEFPLPFSNVQPVGIVTGSDGNLWFAEHTGHHIGRITPSGVITRFPTPSTSYPYGITSGPDGNLWYASIIGNTIGRVTTAGVINEFSLPSGRSPSWITTGSDGNLWFTEIDGNRIGRITPAGAITEFAIPTANSRPQGITRGPDGNLWFAESAGNKIGRITTAGVITEFPLPVANSIPWSITAGPDGNIWFTERAGNKIGRITTGGTITEFVIPTANSVPYDITTGPDGQLWFTEDGGNKIGRISP